MIGIGDRVRFINRKKSEEYPEFYPHCGTVGRIVDIGDDNLGPDLLVQWPEGTVASDGKWWCSPGDVEVIL